MRLILLFTQFLFILFVVPGFGQTELSISGKSLPELQQEVKLSSLSPLHMSTVNFNLPQKKAKPPSLKQIFQNSQNITDMPKAYSYQDLGFFCKLEVQMEKKARFPVKVRLGEVQYVERMEGKME